MDSSDNRESQNHASPSWVWEQILAHFPQFICVQCKSESSLPPKWQTDRQTDRWQDSQPKSPFSRQLFYVAQIYGTFDKTTLVERPLGDIQGGLSASQASLYSTSLTPLHGGKNTENSTFIRYLATFCASKSRIKHQNIQLHRWAQLAPNDFTMLHQADYSQNDKSDNVILLCYQHTH